MAVDFRTRRRIVRPGDPIGGRHFHAGCRATPSHSSTSLCATTTAAQASHVERGTPAQSAPRCRRPRRGRAGAKRPALAARPRPPLTSSHDHVSGPRDAPGASPLSELVGRADRDLRRPRFSAPPRTSRGLPGAAGSNAAAEPESATAARRLRNADDARLRRSRQRVRRPRTRTPDRPPEHARRARLSQHGEPAIRMRRPLILEAHTGDFMLRGRVADALMTVCGHASWPRLLRPLD
jgi:hypothetical protein